MPALQDTVGLELPPSTRKSPRPQQATRPRTGKNISLDLEAPPRKAREPLASQEIFQDLDQPDLALDQPDEPDEPQASEEVSLDLSSLEVNMVHLDGLESPDEPEEDLEFDLDQKRVGDEEFLPGPEPDEDADDRFNPKMDDGVESLAMLGLADTPYTSGLASRETGPHDRTTDPHDPVRRHRATGSAAFDGEQEDDFHRSAIWVLLVITLFGAAWAVWPDRYTLWTQVTGDFSTLKMLQLKTVPADAQVYINGKLEKSRPIRFSEDQEKIDLRVQKEGYSSHTQTVKTGRDKPLEVVLKKR